MLSSQGPLRSSSGAHYLVTEYGYLALREAHMGEGVCICICMRNPRGWTLEGSNVLHGAAADRFLGQRLGIRFVSFPNPLIDFPP